MYSRRRQRNSFPEVLSKRLGLILERCWSRALAFIDKCRKIPPSRSVFIRKMKKYVFSTLLIVASLCEGSQGPFSNSTAAMATDGSARGVSFNRKVTICDIYAQQARYHSSLNRDFPTLFVSHVYNPDALQETNGSCCTLEAAPAPRKAFPSPRDKKQFFFRSSQLQDKGSHLSDSHSSPGLPVTVHSAQNSEMDWKQDDGKQNETLEEARENLVDHPWNASLYPISSAPVPFERLTMNDQEQMDGNCCGEEPEGFRRWLQDTPQGVSPFSKEDIDDIVEKSYWGY